MAVNNFANPIDFICGGIQAASRMNADQSAKLCVQYLAPIIKNRQYNFPPIGTTIGLGLLVDTLIVRSLMTPSIAALMGKWFWWPQRVRSRPIPSPWPSPPSQKPVEQLPV